MGIVCDRQRRIAAECESLNAEELYAKHGLQDDDMNARQAFQKVKVSAKVGILTKPTFVTNMRLKILTCIDRSYKNNKNAYFSLAGAGAWWPARTLQNKPL